MHPKNAQRRDAITNKRYVEVITVGDATTFLKGVLETLLRSRVQAMGKELTAEAQAKLTKRGLSLFVTAPDAHYAAAVLASTRYTIQDRTEFYDAVINAAGTPGCPDYERKLVLLNMEYYHGRRLYANGFKRLDERNEFLRPIHFKAWTDLVAKRKILTKAQFVKIFPDAAYKAELWDNCIDETGRPKNNPAKFWTYVNEKKKNKREKKALEKA